MTKFSKAALIDMLYDIVRGIENRHNLDCRNGSDQCKTKDSLINYGHLDAFSALADMLNDGLSLDEIRIRL